MFAIRSLKSLIGNLGRTCSTELAHRPAPVMYGNPVMPDKLYKTVELEMRGAEPAVLKSYQTFILMAARHLDITVGHRWGSKPKKQRWTLLKSVFIYKKHFVQYEVRTHYKWIQLHRLTGSTADTFLEYVERMLPEGVALKVTKISIEPMPSHLEPKKITEGLGQKSTDTAQNEEL